MKNRRSKQPPVTISRREQVAELDPPASKLLERRAVRAADQKNRQRQQDDDKGEHSPVQEDECRHGHFGLSSMILLLRHQRGNEQHIPTDHKRANRQNYYH